MSENEGKAVRVSLNPVDQVRYSFKTGKLLFSAPHYVLRGPIYAIVLITVFGVVYSFIGEKDEIVAAPLSLKKDITVLQAPAGGILSQLHVTAGSTIDYGSPLVDIQFKTAATIGSETELLQERLDKIETELKFAGKERVEMENRLRNLSDQVRENRENAIRFEQQVQNERKAYEGNLESAAKKVQSLGESINTLRLELSRKQGTVQTSEAEARKFEERYKEEKALFDKKQSTKPQLDAAELDMIRSKQRWEDAKNLVEQDKNEISKSMISLSEAQDAPKRLKNEWEQQALRHEQTRQGFGNRIQDLEYQIKNAKLLMEKGASELEKERDKLRAQIEKSRTLIQGVRFEGNYCRVSATYTGQIIKSLKKAGEQVSKGEPLFEVLKDSEPLYAEILVNNQDRTRLKEGVDVQIKYAAYPYQEHQIQVGSIKNIPPTPEQVENQSFYRVRVGVDPFIILFGKNKYEEKLAEAEKRYSGEELKRAQARLAEKYRKPLDVGLQGWAEIQVGKKRLIEVVFKPLEAWLSGGE